MNNVYIFMQIPVTQLCVGCKSARKNPGYNYCSKLCAQNHRVIPQTSNFYINQLCINCRAFNVNFGYNYCSIECGRMHKIRQCLNMCARCHFRPKLSIYGNYCSFNCHQS